MRSNEKRVLERDRDRDKDRDRDRDRDRELDCARDNMHTTTCFIARWFS
jgi:hypothetical protein